MHVHKRKFFSKITVIINLQVQSLHKELNLMVTKNTKQESKALMSHGNEQILISEKVFKHMKPLLTVNIKVKRHQSWHNDSSIDKTW